MQANWQTLLDKSIASPEDLPDRLRGDKDRFDMNAAKATAKIYPLRINPFYAELIRDADDAVGRQVIPDIREIRENDNNETVHGFTLEEDPLAEEKQSPRPGLIHRYPDRVVLLASSRCPVLCRFCMRKRLTGISLPPSPARLAEALAYIADNKGIREVILSGGDPLLVEDAALENILGRLRTIPHLEVIRIHSRTPCALPQRITPELVKILNRYHPLYLNIHVNHPREISEGMAAACAELAAAGIPLGSQTVLLKGINDSTAVMENLFRSLLRIRVRPYYLHHPDLIRSTGHFRVSVDTGLAIMAALQGKISGTALPRYMIDLPGGGGKVPLLPNYIRQREKGRLIIDNYQGKPFYYPADA